MKLSNGSTIFLVGLIIISIAIGTMHEATDGWFTLGAGVMLVGICEGIISYLDRGKN